MEWLPPSPANPPMLSIDGSHSPIFKLSPAPTFRSDQKTPVIISIVFFFETNKREQTRKPTWRCRS